MTESEQVVVRMQTRGRLTVPAAYRRRHGWDEGAEIVLEETARGILITPRPELARFETTHAEERRAGEELLLRDLSPDTSAPSPGVLNMLRLGEALRARLREPFPASVGD